MPKYLENEVRDVILIQDDARFFGGASLPLLLLLAALFSMTLLVGCSLPTEGGLRRPPPETTKPVVKAPKTGERSPVEADRLSYKTTAGTSRALMTTTVIGSPVFGGGAGPDPRQTPTASSLTAEGVADYAHGEVAMTIRVPGKGPL